MNHKLFALISMLTLWTAFALIGSPTGRSVEAMQTVDLSPSDVSRTIIPPTKKRKLLAWLKAGVYKEMFTPEPEIHDSLGPHGGNVRTYYNPILVENLRAGKTVWQSGVAMVKELYLSGKDEIKGYSVEIKVNENSGENGEGWLFFETFDLVNGSGFYGRGAPVCVGCHRTGVDYLQSRFRP